MSISTSPRFHEIDLWRGLAILSMVLFHAVYDLNFFGFTAIDLWSGGWLVLARAIQWSFMLTTGMTLVISYERARSRGKRLAVQKRLRHAAKLFALAMLITLVTWITFKDQAVTFGILHFFAVAIVLTLPLLRFRAWNSLIGLVIIALSPQVHRLDLHTNGLFPLGIIEPGFTSLDYFPLFPWYGIFLQGVALGFLLYPGGKNRLSFNIPSFTILEKLGQSTLAIYLLHQPILIALIFLAKHALIQ